MLAWSFILAGALYMDIRVRLTLGGIFSIWVLYMPNVGILGALLPMVGVFWAWALLIAVMQWRSAPPHSFTDLLAPPTPPGDLPRWLRPPVTFGVMLGLQTIVCVAYYLDLRAVASDALDLELTSLVFVIVPVLFLTGSDFAEISEQVAESVVSIVGAARRWWWRLVGTVVVAGFALCSALWTEVSGGNHGPWFSVGAALVFQLVLGVALIVGLVLLARRAQAGAWKAPVALSPWVLLAATLLFMSVAATMALSRIFTNWPPEPLVADYAVFKHPASPAGHSPAFSVAYPRTWLVEYALDSGSGASSAQPGETLVRITANDGAYHAPDTFYDPGGEVYVFTAPLAYLSSYEIHHFTAVLDQQFLDGECKGAPCRYTTLPSYHGWTAIAYSAADGSERGTVWLRLDHGRLWMLIGGAPGARAQALLPYFQRMVDSWRPDLHAEAPQVATTEAETVQAMLGQLALLMIAGGVGLLLLARAGGRRSALAVAGLFAVVLGAVEGVYMLYYGLALLHLSAGLGGQPVAGLQVTAAIGTFGVVGWLLWSRRRRTMDYALLRALLVLNGSLIALTWLLGLYSQAMTAGEVFNAGQAIVLVIALGWDLVMSGDPITNNNSVPFPRAGRVLLYCGYIMLVAVLALFFSSQTYLGTGVAKPAVFESESWAQSGLRVLGLPFILFTFVLAAAHWWQKHTRHTQGLTQGGMGAQPVAVVPVTPPALPVAVGDSQPASDGLTTADGASGISRTS